MSVGCIVDYHSRAEGNDEDAQQDYISSLSHRKLEKNLGIKIFGTAGGMKTFATEFITPPEYFTKNYGHMKKTVWSECKIK